MNTPDSGKSNWFPVRKRALVFTVLYICAAIIAINPHSFVTLTAGGTAFIALFSILLQGTSPFLAFIDALMPDEDEKAKPESPQSGKGA